MEGGREIESGGGERRGREREMEGGGERETDRPRQIELKNFSMGGGTCSKQFISNISKTCTTTTRERETERETDRQRERDRETETDRTQKLFNGGRYMFKAIHIKYFKNLYYYY